jgi:membrane protein DedA with SNARE-associated domain
MTGNARARPAIPNPPGAMLSAHPTTAIAVHPGACLRTTTDEQVDDHAGSVFLTSILDSAVALSESAVGAAGWLGLAAVMAVENVFPPIPSEMVLPLAGAQVAGGTLTYMVAVLAATLGSTAGAALLYMLGRAGGRPLLLRMRPLLRLDEARLDRAEAWFVRRGDLFVFVGRLVPGLRSLVSVPAGMARMPFWRFLLLTALGSMAWNAGLIKLGEALADRWSEVSSVVAPAFTGLLAATAALVPALWLWRRHRAAA